MALRAPSHRLFAAALCLLAAASLQLAAAQTPPTTADTATATPQTTGTLVLMSCADIPVSGDDGPWEDLSEELPTAITDQVYAIWEQRSQDASIPDWTNCEAPTVAAAGCQQTAGDGVNYMLQLNYTCPDGTGESTLGLTADVNTYSTFVNVDDLDVEFVAVNGEITQGALDQANWWETNDEVFGTWQNEVQDENEDENNNDNQNDNNNQDENNNNNNNDDNQDDNDQQLGEQEAQQGEAIGEQEAQQGEAIGEQFAAAGEAMGRP